MSQAYFKPSARRGLTLVEVVAGIALLATLLVMILVTHQANARQVRASQDRLLAVQLAESLLTAWSVSQSQPPIGAEGEFAQKSEWRWRLAREEPVLIGHVEVGVSRLEIVGKTNLNKSEVILGVSFLASEDGQ